MRNRDQLEQKDTLLGRLLLLLMLLLFPSLVPDFFPTEGMVVDFYRASGTKSLSVCNCSFSILHLSCVLGR